MTHIMEKLNFKLNEEEMFSDISEGMAIVINSMTGIYYGMNGFGSSVYENLLAGSSTADIVAAARSLPSCPDNFEESLAAFTDKLLSFGVVVPAGPSDREAALNPEAAEADAFIPECTEYSDVQELLYADPIHEVDEEKGWTPE